MDKEEKIIEAQEAADRAATAPIADSKTLIAVTQLPIIEERLRDYKAEIEATVAEAKSMVATAETVQAVKAKRAELRKQFDDLEKRRIAVKSLILEPYERFNKVYDECVRKPFSDADTTLKATVDGFEGELKAAALEKLKNNFDEHCRLEGIDWLSFDTALSRSGVKVGMADAKTKEPRKAMDALAEYVSKIALGLDQIRKMEDSAEILVEYKKCLDVGQAASVVQERKRKIREAAEAESRRKEEAARQREMLERVRAAAPAPVPPPAPAQDVTPTPVPPPSVSPVPPAAPETYWNKVSFSIYFQSPEEFQKVRPMLSQLKELLIKEGIRYGK